MPAVVVSQTGNVLQRQRVKNCSSRRDVFDQVGYVNNLSVFYVFRQRFLFCDVVPEKNFSWLAAELV